MDFQLEEGFNVLAYLKGRSRSNFLKHNYKYLIKMPDKFAFKNNIEMCIVEFIR